MIPGGASNNFVNKKYKTSQCRHFMSGNCQLGAKCAFAHGQEELRNMNDPIPQGATTQFYSSPMSGMGTGASMYTMKPQGSASNYKTIKCKYFEQGFCKNQQSCTFAHGDMEIRSLGMAPYSMQMDPYMVQQQQLQQQQQQQQQTYQTFIYVLRSLESVFKNHQGVSQQLKEAIQQVTMQDFQAASAIIQEIMQSSERTEAEIASYSQIWQNAQQISSPAPYYQQSTGYQTQPGGYF